MSGSIDGNSNILKLGKNGQQINLNNLKAGIKLDDKSKAIFDKFDSNNNGILEQKELDDLKKALKPFMDDGMITKGESKKVLKGIDLQKKTDGEELFKFLESMEIDSGNIEDSYYSLFDDVQSVNVKYKKDADGNQKIVSYNQENGVKIQDYLEQSDGTQITTKYGEAGNQIVSKETRKGSVTTLEDGAGNILKKITNKGGGLQEVVEYEYEGDSATPSKISTTKPDGTKIVEENGTKTTTKPDGTVIIEKEGVVTTTFADGTKSKTDGENSTKTLPSGRVITTTKDENGNNLTTIKENEESAEVTVKYDSDGNIISSAKNGENFEQTAKRLGIEKGTPEFEKFKALNAKASQKGWFQVGAEVKVPAGMEDKINISGLNVDAKSEVENFNRAAISNADISKYNETNTETRTLDKNTTWWELAKESLIAEGNENPTTAEISARTNELQKLNSGNQLTHGSQVTLPKNPQAETPVAEAETLADEASPSTAENSGEVPATPAERYSVSNLEKTYPKDRYTITQEGAYTEVVDKSTGKKILGIFVDNSTANISKYDKNGREYEFVQENAKGIVVERSRKNPETGEYTSAEYFDDNGSKTESREFYKDESGSSYAIVTEYAEGEPYHIYDTSGKTPERYPLAEALRDDIYAKTAIGLPTTGKDIGKHISQINASNVLTIMDAYKKINGDNESLVSAIIAERGLPKEERMQYLTHIRQALIDNAQQSGKYAEDIAANFDKEVRYQMRKVGFADADYLDSYIDKLKCRTSVSVDRQTNLPNGKIDEDFKQGNTGDCWLVASIKAIADTPKGLEILNDSLKVDANGNVTVTLKGAGKSYVITKEELAGNNQFTSGDADVRAIEIAMDRYFQEERGVRGRLDLNGNQAQVAFNLLTGQGGRNLLSATYGRVPDMWFSDSQINNFNKPNHVAVVSTSRKDNLSFQSASGENQTLIANHAYTVKGSDAENVYLINPWDTSKVITVPRDVFKDVFNGIDEFDLK